MASRLRSLYRPRVGVARWAAPCPFGDPRWGLARLPLLLSSLPRSGAAEGRSACFWGAGDDEAAGTPAPGPPVCAGAGALCGAPGGGVGADVSGRPAPAPAPGCVG